MSINKILSKSVKYESSPSGCCVTWILRFPRFLMSCTVGIVAVGGVVESCRVSEGRPHATPTTSAASRNT